MHPSALKSCPLFADLNEDQLVEVASLATVEEYPSSTRLFGRGDPADAFYLIQKGTVRIQVPHTAGEEPKRINLRAPAFFGEIGLVRDSERTADAFAERRTTLIKFTKGAFDSLLATNPAIAKTVTTAILDRLGEYRAEQAQDLADPGRPKTMAFIGASEGAGCSFVTANMAVKLSDIATGDVLAADMHFGKQGMWRYLETLSNFGSYDPLFTASTITPEVVGSCAAKLPSGVFLLSGYAAEMSDSVRTRHAVEVVNQGRKAYEYLLVDLGTKRDDLAVEVIKASDAVHIVCEPTESSLEGAILMANWLKEQGLGDRVRFILNRVYEEEMEVSKADLEAAFGDALLGTIHASDLQPRGVESASPPIVRAAPKSKAAAELTGLCLNLVSQPKAGPLDKVRNMVLWTLGLD